LLSYFITGGLLFALALAFFIFKGYRQKQKANEMITLQKEEVEKQKSIVEEKSLIVEEKNKDILDSIHYAKRIQRAMLTSDSYLKKILPEHFVLYKPKDIVSGDFYWSVKHQNKIYLAVADCTGHGVPGAFMSLVGISFLNEIVIERNISSPEKILNQLREEIIKALNPEDAIEESKDGMDIVICCYDFDTMQLNFAAANNSLYLIRDEQLLEYKADKFPVGKYQNEQSSFTLQTISLQKNDCIYTFTDGFADQFGGPHGKKYKYKQFKEQLLKNHHLSLEIQKKLIDIEIENWKGSLEQIDDILTIGIKI
jgi:serine phosphatase RsbU (regulator of sigma subunit)